MLDAKCYGEKRSRGASWECQGNGVYVERRKEASLRRNVLIKTEEDKGASCVLAYRRERVPDKGAVRAKALRWEHVQHV